MITTYWTRWYQSLADYRYAQMQRFHVRPVVGAAIVEPITLQDAYWHLHIDTTGTSPVSDHDDWLEQFGIPGARAWAESYQGVSIAQQTLELTTDRFPTDDYIDLPYGPVLSITSVKYLDSTGTELDWPDPNESPPEVPHLDNYSQPNRLYLGYQQTWPTDVRSVRNAVKIRYVAGYSLPGESPPGDFPLPPTTRNGMLLLLGHLFNNRETTQSGGGGTTLLHEIPLGAKSFLDWERVRSNFI